MRTIEPGHRSYLKEFLSLYKHRRLIREFSLRDLRIKYSQTVLGILWTIFQPVIMLVVYSVFFVKVLGVRPSPTGTALPLIIFSGIMAWHFFSIIVNDTGSALINAQHLVKKLSFPKLTLIFSKVAVSLVDFGIGLAIFLGYIFLSGNSLPWQAVFFPVFVAYNVFTALSVGLWICSLSVRYKDFQHLVVYIVNFGIWLTPVFYGPWLFDRFPHWVMVFFYINPMAGVIAGYRWTLLGEAMPPAYYLMGFYLAAILLITGLYYFYKTDRRLADYL
jgi:lipopolysaccharide transport system permease protein